MKSWKIVMPLMLSISLVFMIGCGKDDDSSGGGTAGRNYTGAGCANAWATELQAEINEISIASQAYVNDQSNANCQKLKDAYQSYLNALKPYANCTTLTGTNRADYEQAIKDAEDDLDDIC